MAAYPQFAVAIFILKGFIAILYRLIYRKLKRKLYSVILSAVFSGIIVTLGYFTVEYFMYGLGGALSGIPLNSVQNLFAIILSAVLYPLLYRIPQVKDMIGN